MLQKKLYNNQVAVLKEAIDNISSNPNIGELKLGDLAGIRVYKIRMLHQLLLMAYIYKESQNEITLLSFSSHENFYKNLKIQLDSNTTLQTKG